MDFQPSAAQLDRFNADNVAVGSVVGHTVVHSQSAPTQTTLYSKVIGQPHRVTERVRRHVLTTGDSTAPDTDDDNGEFQLVHSRKRHRVFSGKSDIRQDTSNTNSVKQKERIKVVGKLSSSSVKLQASGNIINKTVFCISNVNESVTKDDMMSFLSDASIKVVSCFDAKTRFEGSKAFRVCIASDDAERLLDPYIWPDGVIIREWFFKGKSSSVNNV